MASVVTGGLFNAVAFAGAGYVFYKLGKRGYEEEMKSHNKDLDDTNVALHNLRTATVELYETRNRHWTTAMNHPRK